MPTLDTLRQAVSLHKPRQIPLSRSMRRAAVAAIVRSSDDGAQLLFIRRSEHPRDPWSGHMAFPGGRVDDTDASALAAAKRETHEEVGLDLNAHAALIGRLSDVTAIAKGKPLPMVIAPFVFAMGPTTPELSPNAGEVAEALWVPMGFLMDAENRDTMTHKMLGANIKLPCYHYEGRVIWGLTLRMVDEIMDIVRG